MNIITWNYRGVMKPNFKKTLLDLVAWHRPIIMVITETRMGGDQADAIIRTLPFNGAYSTETIGYVGGIWLLWNSDFVDVEILSTMEQEIHALIRVNSSSLT